MTIKNKYTEEELISFGNYLLERYGVMVYSDDGFNTPLYQRNVHDADVKNWITRYPEKQNSDV